jgi:hypothetical protein
MTRKREICKACGVDYAGQDFGHMDRDTGRCPECVWHIHVCGVCGDPAHIGEMIFMDGAERPITKEDKDWLDA